MLEKDERANFGTLTALRILFSSCENVFFMYFYCKSICILIAVYVFLLFVHVFLLLSTYS
jgi:hypothetical protein